MSGRIAEPVGLTAVRREYELTMCEVWVGSLSGISLHSPEET